MNKKSVFGLGWLCITLFFYSCSTSTYCGRWFLWNRSEIDDYEKFPAYPLNASDDPFFFPSDVDEAISHLRLTKKEGKKDELLNILNDTRTTAFIIILNDTLIYEKYLNGYTRESINTSFSVAKSITSFMVGKATDEGLIDSRQDHITKYLPAIAETDSGYLKIKLSHLLDMRSGIQFIDHDLIWGDKPKAYYHPRLRERIRELPVTTEPGNQFKYNPYNTILVGMILEEITGMSPAKYFQETIWDKMGMEYSGSWSMDSKSSGMTKMESGLNLRAIDFAKFGRLVLNEGYWNDVQILSEKWMDDCFKIDEYHKVESYPSGIYYKNFWWLFSNNGQEPYIISGWGHLGQYLYIFPNENLILVRMGKNNKGIDSWSRLFIEIRDKIISS